MSGPRLDPRHEQALICLMDDESSAVREALVEEFRRLGLPGITLLREIAGGGNRLLSSHARELLAGLSQDDTVADFVRFIRSLNYELETGCLLLNRTIDPELEISESCIGLDAIAARCRALMVLPSSPWERCKVLNRVLFHEYGFRGNAEDFDNPENIYLSSVLKTRKGIPVTLSILYLLVAQRCDLTLEPIALPGRFMVGCFLEDEPFYIDPYERGAFRTPEELQDMLVQNDIKPRKGYLAPTAVGEVICRCCRNLAHRYSHLNDHVRARMFTDFVREFESTHRRHARP